MTNAQLNLQHLAAIVQFSDDAIIGTTLDLTIVSWNASAERLYGYSAAEMLGTSAARLFPPERKTEEESFHRKFIAAETPGHYETERIRKDGQLIYVSITLSPIKNANGIIIGVSSAARDVTGRRRAEAERELLAAIVQSSEDAIIGKTVDGIITSWNIGAEKLYGYTAAEALGKPVTILIPPDRANDFPLIMRRIKNGEKVEHYETVRQRKDGVRLDVSLTVSPIRDSHGTIFGASAIARDITERKRMELALRHSEERFRRLVDTAPGAILIIDGAGHIVLVNERVEALFGYEPDELIGLSVEVLLPQQFRHGHAAYRMDYFAQPSARLMGIGRELFGQRKDGSEFPVEIGLSYVLTESGMLAMAFVTDITERKRAEAERTELLVREQEARAQAERIKFEERDRIAMELHDGIIQSIYAVGMGLEIARTTLVSDPKLNDLIVNSTRDLDSVIEDLRRYIRDLKVANEYPLQFRQQLGDLERRFHDSATARLVIDIPDALTFLNEAYLHSIVQLVREALSNIARHANATEVHLVLQESPSEIVLTIADNGTGFDVDTVDLGSGLNNIRQRTRQLNGTVDIVSRLQHGTILTFKFPVVQAPPTALR